MKCRNLNCGKRNAPIEILFRGQPRLIEKMDGGVEPRTDAFPPTVFFHVGNGLGLFTLGFHMDIKSAEGLIEELAHAIKQAKRTI